MLLLITVSFFALTSTQETPSDALDPITITEVFNEFVEEFGKVYPTPSDQMNAFTAFSANLLKIEGLKKEFEGQNIEFGINQYSDLNDVEFGEKVANLKADEEEKKTTVRAGRSSGSVPSFLDWRTRKNTVGRVTDQGIGKCGWAFAVSSAVQSAYSFKTTELVQPRETDMCECCSARSVREGLEWIEEFGVPLEGNGTACDSEQKISVESFSSVSPNTEAGLKRALVENGPLLVQFQVGFAFRHYKSGVFNGTDCRNTGTFIGWHAATVVGYGIDSGIPFWTVKNSWGETFGERGYFRIARARDLCSFESAPAYYFEL